MKGKKFLKKGKILQKNIVRKSKDGMARINPSLVIVYGDMIEGMFGTFINFRYVDGFNRKYEQLSLFNEKVFTIMGGK